MSESEANKEQNNTSTCMKFQWNAIALVSLNIQEYNKLPVIFLHVLFSHSVIVIIMYVCTAICTYIHILFGRRDNVRTFTCDLRV